MTRALLLLLSLLVTAALAGCGTPDEQESDENAASEQESVGEGEVPGVGLLGIGFAVVLGAVLFAWRR